MQTGRLTAPGHDEITAVVRGESFKHSILRAQVEKIRIRVGTAQLAALLVSFKYCEQSLRFGKRQWSQQDCIHHTKDCGVSADAECQCNGGHDADAGRLQQHAKPEANVLK